VAHGEGRCFDGAIHVDGALPAVGEKHDAEGVQGHRRRIYPTKDDAVARFRFSPPQPCENPYLVDYIARTSLAPTIDAQGEPGWSWCFDPDLRRKTLAVPAELLAAEPRCRVALVFGERSRLMTLPRLERIRDVTPAGAPWIVIPDAGHHIMVDQPLALVATVRALIALWQPSVSQRDATLLELQAPSCKD
jgi:pimeloyl-ACP methyl ester carboxylesterase